MHVYYIGDYMKLTIKRKLMVNYIKKLVNQFIGQQIFWFGNGIKF